MAFFKLSSGSHAARLQLEGLEARDVPAARLQLINNSPFSNNNFDVYINDAKYLDDLSFRTASPFGDVADTTPLKIDIVPSTATNNKSPLFTTTLTLLPNSKNIGVLVGNPADTASAAKLDLRFLTSAREASSTAGKAEVMVMHGSPDAPPVDVKVRGVGTVVDDIAYPLFNSTYLSLTPAKYTIDLALSDGVTRVNSYTADLSGAAGKTLTILASGFVSPPAGGPSLALLAVQADGFVRTLSTTTPYIDQSFAAGGINSGVMYNFKGQSQFSLAPFEAGSKTGVRVMASDMNADGVPDLVVGSGPGRVGTVTVYDGKTNEVFRSFAAFETTFKGGVLVSVGDLDGDTIPDMIVTPDDGGGARVRVFRGRDGTVFADFLGIEDPSFRGGARTAVGDLNADGKLDLLVAAGNGGGPRIAGFNGLTIGTNPIPVKLFGDFFVFEPTLRNGVFLASGDINNDGFADIIAGGGPGGGPRVFGLSGQAIVDKSQTQTQILNFFAGDVSNRDGVRLAVKDLDGDYQADLVVGLGSVGVPQVRAFAGKNVLTSSEPGSLFDLRAFEVDQPQGVFVG